MLKAASPPGGALKYVSDADPGWTRVRRRSTFAYLDKDGKPLRDPDEVDRIRRLAIPPAYTQVWICPRADGHLQATGRDARGRKQYRYHADWHAQRGADKFSRMEAFGQALPRIRARVARDLKPRRGQPLSRQRLLATLVRLLDTTCIRVGNEEYARENGSFGLTTLRSRHAKVKGKSVLLKFRAKSGVLAQVEVDDPRVVPIIRKCQELPGQELFQYEDDDGTLHTLGSADVNDYLAEAAGGERFTAKDFRTWHGTVHALELTCGGFECTAEAPKFQPKEVVANVARRLGNTVAVCRKSYIHPEVLAMGQQLAVDAVQTVARWTCLTGADARRRGLSAAEGRLLLFLKELERAQRRNTKKSRAARLLSS